MAYTSLLNHRKRKVLQSHDTRTSTSQFKQAHTPTRSQRLFSRSIIYNIYCPVRIIYTIEYKHPLRGSCLSRLLHKNFMKANATTEREKSNNANSISSTFYFPPVFSPLFFVTLSHLSLSRSMSPSRSRQRQVKHGDRFFLFLTHSFHRVCLARCTLFNTKFACNRISIIDPTDDGDIKMTDAQTRSFSTSCGTRKCVENEKIKCHEH